MADDLRTEPFAPLLTPEEVAGVLRIPVATLHRWSWEGVGPSPVKVGRHLRYVASELAAWIERQRKGAS